MTTEMRLLKVILAPPALLRLIDRLLEGNMGGEVSAADRRLLTFSETAKVMGLSRQTIWRMVGDGRLPTIEIRSGSHRIPSQAVTDFLMRGMRAGCGV